MKGKVQMLLGTKKFTIEAEGDEKTLIKEISFWSQMPEKCGNCGSNDLVISYRSPQGNDYYGMKCLKCSADNNFGQYKTGGFYHKNEWNVWQGDKK